MNKAAWSRVPLWILLIVSITINVLMGMDYFYMDEAFRAMKSEFIEDVVGYDYCDTFEEVG